MGSLISALGFGDDRRIELVKKIALKTQQGKIQWIKTSQGLSATASGLNFNFVESIPAVFGYHRWVLFTVRDNKANEILKIENTSAPISAIPTVVPFGIPSLVGAVDELYNSVRGSFKGEIENAIDILDKL